MNAFVASVSLAAIGAMAVPAFAQSPDSSFVTVKSAHGYSSTVSALQHSISVGTAILAAIVLTGLRIATRPE